MGFYKGILCTFTKAILLIYTHYELHISSKKNNKIIVIKKTIYLICYISTFNHIKV